MKGTLTAAGVADALAWRAGETTKWLQVGQMLVARERRLTEKVHVVYERKGILYCGAQTPECTLTGKDKPDVELSAGLLIPPLIDAHTHVFLEGGELDAQKRSAYQTQPPEILLGLARERLMRVAQMGICAMRDGGDKDGVGLALAAKHNGGMPQVYSPGPGIFRSGRYGSFFGSPLEDDHDIPICVKRRVDAGASHIKVVPTGIINFAKGAVVAQPQFTVEELTQMVTVAHGLGRQVMAHASGEAGIAVAIAAGVDSIEHGYFITREQLSRMRDSGIAWVPTFVPVQVQVDEADRMGWKGEALDNLKKILDGHATSLQAALEKGVRVRIGSDAGSYGVPHGSGLYRELELMVRAGMSVQNALGCGTHDNADLLPSSHIPASVEAGAKAGFVIILRGAHDGLADLARSSVAVVNSMAAPVASQSAGL